MVVMDETVETPVLHLVYPTQSPRMRLIRGSSFDQDDRQESRMNMRALLLRRGRVVVRHRRRAEEKEKV